MDRYELDQIKGETIIIQSVKYKLFLVHNNNNVHRENDYFS